MRPQLEPCTPRSQAGEAPAGQCFTYSVDRECLCFNAPFTGAPRCHGRSWHSCTPRLSETSVRSSRRGSETVSDDGVWLVSPVSQLLLRLSPKREERAGMRLWRAGESFTSDWLERGRCRERGGRKDKFRHEREELFGARGEPRC